MAPAAILAPLERCGPVSLAFVDSATGAHVELADVAKEWVEAELGDGRIPNAMECANAYRITYTPELARLVLVETEKQTACETCGGTAEVYERGRFAECPDCAA